MAVERILAFNAGDLFRRLGAQKTVREYRNKQTIFAQGDAADAMFYVQHGNVKLTVVSKQGKKAVLAILGRGDLFGEGCLAQRSLRMSTATAVQRSTIARVRKGTIGRVIRQEPAFAKLLIAYLLSRIVRTQEDVVDQLLNSSERRLARVLLLLVGFGEQSKSDPEPALLRVSQATLAQMVGTTRSRVSYFMNQFKKKGFIHYNGGGLRVQRALLTSFVHA
jgi:CRP-like cAMP-binding protein